MKKNKKVFSEDRTADVWLCSARLPLSANCSHYLDEFWVIYAYFNGDDKNVHNTDLITKHLFFLIAKVISLGTFNQDGLYLMS
jgi:hypothetical protein